MVLTIPLNSAVVHVEFEPKEYTVLETEDALLLGVVKRNSTDRPINVFFSTRAGTAVGEYFTHFSRVQSILISYRPYR